MERQKEKCNKSFADGGSCIQNGSAHKSAAIKKKKNKLANGIDRQG